MKPPQHIARRFLFSITLKNLLCHLYSGNPHAALREMLGRNCAYQPAEVEHYLLNEVLSETYTVRAYVDLSQYEDAAKHAKQARSFANRTQSIRADINALVAEGLATTFNGKHDEGIALLRTAVARATESNVVTVQARQSLVKALEFAQRNEDAVFELKAMMSAQRKTAETNALEHVKQHLATLHGGDIRQTTEEVVQAMRVIEGRIELLEGRVAKSELATQRQELFQARVETMERLAVAAELRYDATGEHAYRVGRLALLLAKEVGCDDDTVFMIDVAARLHNIGKISVPDHILLKPSKLNGGERAVIGCIRRLALTFSLRVPSHIFDWPKTLPDIITNAGTARVIRPKLAGTRFPLPRASRHSRTYTMR